LFRIFSSPHPMFIKHAKAANNLCDKVKPITSGGLNLPTSNFTARAIITNEKKTYFSLRAFDSGVQSALLSLISSTRTKHDLLSFYIVVSKFERWKGRNFCGRPRATLSFATPLSTIFLTANHLCRFHD